MRPPITREDIRRTEDVENRHHARIHATCALRERSREDWQAWSKAAEAWHAQLYPTDVLWTDEFRAALKASSRDAIEQAILYLEVDPWYFRSGYLKDRLIRGLKRANLKEKDRDRLRNVIWNVVMGRNRTEFRRYCGLAALIVTEDFRRMLESRFPESDAASQGKLGYLIRFLEKHAPR